MALIVSCSAKYAGQFIQITGCTDRNPEVVKSCLGGTKVDSWGQKGHVTPKTVKGDKLSFGPHQDRKYKSMHWQI